MNLDLFTAEQRDTYDKIHELEARLEEKYEADTFELNEEANEIREAINDLQKHCHHIFDDYTCVICGAEEDQV